MSLKLSIQCGKGLLPNVILPKSLFVKFPKFIRYLSGKHQNLFENFLGLSCIKKPIRQQPH